MSSIRNDLGFAVRTLLKSPVFTVTAVGTIALGIGATTAIFSIVNTVLLRPLPYANQERLAFVTSDMTARSVFNFPMAPGDFPDLRRGATEFDEIAGLVTFRQPLIDERGEAQMLRAAGVTSNFLRTLGVRVVLGRDFVEEDGFLPPPPEGAAENQGGQPAQLPPGITILSHEFWQRQFGSDSSVIGRNIQLGGQTAQVVGVLEPGVELFWFEDSSIEQRPDLYTVMRINFETASRVNVFLRVVGRLRPGATFASAQEQVNGIVTDLRQRFPIKETAGVRWRVEPMHKYVVASTRPAILTLMGAVGFVLLIACANVANLLLVRTSQRERELAVRAALGGNRGALVRQMLVESFVIAGAGAALGLWLASAAIGLLTVIGPDNLPRLDQIRIDPVVLVFTMLAAGLSAVIFGIVPALRASRVDVADILRTGGRSPSLSGAGKWLRAGVVTAEVALAFVLLVGSGLMIRSFVALQRAAPGFDPSGVLAFAVANVGEPTPEGRAAVQRRIHERLRAIPGVTGVSAALPLPLEGQASNTRWGLEAALTNPALFQQADLRVVLPDYFAVMRTRLLDGRAFTEADNVPGHNLVMVDDVFAEKAFPGESAVGKRFLARIGGPEPDWWEIIGVVRHQRNASLAVDGRETMYMVDAQGGFGAANRWLVRTEGDPSRLVPAVRAAVRELNPRYVLSELQPYTALLDRARAPTRFALVCIGVFAVVAVVLASVGLYGVLSTLVRQRTAEIGVRMAFGASGTSVFRLVVGQGMRLAVVGIGAGLLAAFALTRVMQTMLVGVSATDPLTFAAIVALFLGVTTIACWVPARRAARLDPLVALREES
ncbi:MAG TPA: ABC transporter permease [Gemmatimonadaceae bacterium]|nr:ABC transporter permease [Gemmatimonadaceae bacterium]